MKKLLFLWSVFSIVPAFAQSLWENDQGNFEIFVLPTQIQMTHNRDSESKNDTRLSVRIGDNSHTYAASVEDGIAGDLWFGPTNKEKSPFGMYVAPTNAQYFGGVRGDQKRIQLKISAVDHDSLSSDETIFPETEASIDEEHLSFEAFNQVAEKEIGYVQPGLHRLLLPIGSGPLMQEAVSDLLGSYFYLINQLDWITNSILPWPVRIINTPIIEDLIDVSQELQWEFKNVPGGTVTVKYRVVRVRLPANNHRVVGIQYGFDRYFAEESMKPLASAYKRALLDHTFVGGLKTAWVEAQAHTYEMGRDAPEDKEIQKVVNHEQEKIFQMMMAIRSVTRNEVHPPDFEYRDKFNTFVKDTADKQFTVFYSLRSPIESGTEGKAIGEYPSLRDEQQKQLLLP